MFDPDAIPAEALRALEALLDHLRACQKRREQEKASAEPTTLARIETEGTVAALYTENVISVRESKR